MGITVKNNAYLLHSLIVSTYLPRNYKIYIENQICQHNALLFPFSPFFYT